MPVRELTNPVQKNPHAISKQTVHFVREEVRKAENGGLETILIDAHMPIGRGYAPSTVVDYVNMGWQVYDEYMARKNSEQAAAKRDEAKAVKGSK